jgi:hypothetical protein
VNRYFIVGNLARDEEEVVRFASLLRGMESASQAVSVRHLPPPSSPFSPPSPYSLSFITSI